MRGMRLLILGGTVFYGRHVTEEALRRGHEVTLFTRGLHNAELFENANKLTGERDGGLDALKSGEWDAVLDTCGYVPRVVRQSAELLKDRAKTYAFVSSISVFSGEGEGPIVETSSVSQPEDPQTEVVDGATYGGLKALCEEAVNAVWEGSALVIRPGLIVGPYDTSDRFTYWPWRLSRGGRVVAPDRPSQAVQIVDARDLAQWTLDMLESGCSGVFNGTGPLQPYTLGEVLSRVKSAVGGLAELIPVPISMLEDKDVRFWTEMPLSHGDESDALMRCDVSKAVSAGLKFRPLEETARDTLAFAQSRGEGYVWRNGLPQEKEARILAAWDAYQNEHLSGKELSK
jgi:2'-hydroxyisoflavone reductase